MVGAPTDIAAGQWVATRAEGHAPAGRHVIFASGYASLKPCSDRWLAAQYAPAMNLNAAAAIVSGGASGLGEATARDLAAAGCRVLVADLNETRGTEPADAEGQRGVVINTASIAGIEGQTGQVAYSASKGGIIGMTVPAARDLAAIGVRVNTICPGIIDTPIYGSGPGSDEFKARLIAPVVFPKRMGTAAEFAQLVRSLIENDYMNAEVIRFDGGIRFQPK